MKSVVTTTASTSLAERPAVDSRLVANLGAVYVVWSSTYLAMGYAVETMPPLWMGCLRFLAAGVVMLALAVWRGAKVPPLRDWLRVAPVGVLLFVGGNGAVAIAEKSVSSGGAAVVCATMPLWLGVLGFFFGARPSARDWVTLTVGFLGVFVLAGGPSLTGEPAHIALAIASPICWAIGSLLSRRTKDVGGAHATLVGPALQMLTGGAALALAALVHGESLPLHASARSWLALGYLWIFGSLVAFTAYAWLLRNARPVVATSYAYVNPILAVLFGAAFRGEPLGWSTLLANVLIVGAVMLALRKPRSTR
jgi:drug/metabolite transporter (DMT)-like permease